jgi:Cu(I)/Ag(I) efflux system membrane fusion protein/cobalt-zinc-cadmium efflux system membrane fusion protein
MPGVIRIDPAIVQNIGVVSEPVERGDLKMEIRTVGVLAYNQKNVYVISTKFEGWIEKVYINYVGQVVRKGEPLFEIYSPDLVSTQQEYLSALKYRERMKESGFPEALAGANQLLSASRSRLLYWDISQKQIEKLEQTGEVKKTLTFSSPANGVVIEKKDVALEGKMASPGMELYQIADISSLWLYVDVYQYQLPWVKVGQQADIEINYFPGESFKGKVLFFDPSVNEQTRTVRMNIEVPNKDGRLRPQMFATVKISPVAVKDAVLIPKSAVLHTGERTVVVVDLGDGRFQPREVKLGIEGTDAYQVLEGLEAGEKVLISAQFLIDSESNLREAVTKMTQDHGGMPMNTPSGEPQSSGSGAEGGQMQMPGM